MMVQARKALYILNCQYQSVGTVVRAAIALPDEMLCKDAFYERAQHHVCIQRLVSTPERTARPQT